METPVQVNAESRLPIKPPQGTATESNPRLKHIWERMLAIYGDGWALRYGDEAKGIAAETWKHGLADLSGEQLAEGFRALIRSGKGFPPTLPEFRALCMGVPAFAVAVSEMRPGNPSPSPFARLMWRFMDPYAYRQASADRARDMARDAFEAAKTFLLAGGELPEPSLALAKDETHERDIYERQHFERFAALSELQK